jgi:hypothetical protein
LLLPLPLPPLHLPSLSPAFLVSVAITHIVAIAVACPSPLLPLLLPTSPPTSLLLHDTFVVILFWTPLLLPSAVATTTTNTHVSTAITVNAATAASIFTNVCLCFCHYPHHHFRMFRSSHNYHFCHSCCRFLVGYCLTHCCHCSANAFANATTSQRAFASHSPGWLLRGFLSRHSLLTHHRLLMPHLVVVSPLVALPSHLSQLVVASPLVAPPLPLNAPTAASQRTIASPCIGASNSLLPFVKNTPPAPGRLFFLMLVASGWVDKDGNIAWFLVGVGDVVYF